MTLHLTPKIEEALKEEARRKGTTPERLALKMLEEELVQERVRTSAKDCRDLARLMAFAGSLDSIDTIAGDNDDIDADLAREYSRGL